MPKHDLANYQQSFRYVPPMLKNNVWCIKYQFGIEKNRQGQETGTNEICYTRRSDALLSEKAKGGKEV